MLRFFKLALLTVPLLLGIDLSIIASPITSDHQSISAKEVTKIGILVPIEHEAMNEILAGFKAELKENYKGPVKLIVKNGQGDTNLQRSILQEFKQEDVDLYVPIGTQTTLMTIALVRNKPIVGIAALYTEKQRAKRWPCNVTVVNDETPISKKQLIFLKTLLPDLTQITIVHSPEDKVMRKAEEFSENAKKMNVQTQDLMVQQLSDLYSVSTKISDKSQIIFLFKDNLIASGINTLIKAADRRDIPLVTSDDGTVKNGASFALGFKEYEIGVQGAKLVEEVLNGKKVCKIPIKNMEELNLFINPTAASHQGLNQKNIEQTAHSLNYPVVIFDNKRS